MNKKIFKFIFCLIALAVFLIPATIFAANEVTITPNGQNVNIKITDVPEGTDLNKDIIVTGPSGQRISMTSAVNNGILTLEGTDNPGSPGVYTYKVAIKGSALQNISVITTATPPSGIGSGKTLLPSGEPADRKLSDIETLIANIGNLMLSIAGGLAVIYIIIGAYHYFFAFGSEEQATTAKKTITYAIVGLVVIILSKVILTEVWNFFAADKINFFF